MLRPPSYFQSPNILPQVNDVTTDTLSQSCPHIPSELNPINLQSNNQIISQLQNEVKSLNKEISERTTNNVKSQHSNIEDKFALADENVSKLAESQTKHLGSIKFYELLSENSNLKTKFTQFEDTIQKLENDKRNLVQKIEFEKCEKEKLKEAHIDYDSFKIQEEKYLQKIAELQDKTYQSVKQCHFLNIQLESLQEIMKLHESKLTNDLEESRRNIISLWRVKVFTLLTQKKIAEFDIQRFEQDIETECQDLRILNQDLESEKALLLLTLNAKSAEIDSLQHSLKITETGIDKKTEENEYLVGDNQQLKHTLNLTKSMIINFNSQLNEFAISKKSVLSNFQQRLLFLTKRVNFLVDYISQQKFGVKSAEKSVQVSFPDSAFFDDNEQHHGSAIGGLTHGNLVNEVSFLMRERSILQGKLKEISNGCEDKLQTIQNNSAIEISNLSDNLAELSQTLVSKNEIIAQNEEKTFQLSNLNSGLSEQMTRLQYDFENLKLQHKNDLSHTVLELQTTHCEKIREMEFKLSEYTLNLQNSRSEFKQLQDNFSYERELAVTIVKLEKEALERKITDLKLHIQAIEAEKYLLRSNSQKSNAKFFASKNSQTQSQHMVLMNENLCLSGVQTDAQILNVDAMQILEDKKMSETVDNKETEVPVADFYNILNEVTQLSNKVFSMP